MGLMKQLIYGKILINGTLKKITMKLYTKKQLKEAYNKGRTDWINEIENDNILSTLTPIELPSDEEIGKEMDKLPFSKNVDDGLFNDGQLMGFELGAKWMKEQILNQNK